MDLPSPLMPDSSAADFPCPHCLQDILLDEDTAGREVPCPHCEERVLLPKLAVAGKRTIALKPIVPKSKSAKKEPPQRTLPLELVTEPQPEPTPEPKNFPIHKHVALAERVDLELKPEHETILPSKEKSREEETRRLAAMAGNVDYDLAKFQRKGMITFGCPLCRRPMWVAKKDAGMMLSCEGCSSEVISPRPELGLPAQIAESTDDEPVSLLPKAVLPTSRRVEDVTLKEGQAGGRTRRMAPLPKESLTTPAGETAPLPQRGKTLEPVPARADESMNGSPVTLPSERISTARTVGGKRAAEPTPQVTPPAPQSAGVVAPREAKVAKGAVRLNNQRRNFSPQKEMETDLEITEAWGQAEDKPPVSRRYVIIGWLVMIPIFLGLLIWGMKEVFRKKTDLPVATNSVRNDKNEAEIVRVAQGVLAKFYDAKTIDEMARYVRHPEITKPRMENWYHRPYPHFRVESFSEAQVSNVEGVEFIIGLLQLSGERPRSVALEVPDEATVGILAEDLRIDWESMVYWSEQTWDNFLAQQGERSCEFRVVLKRDSYPNAPYDDENRWVCFKLNYPGTVQEQYGYCFGYVELNSDAATAMIQPMRRAAENGVDSLNATVRLRFRPDASSRKNLVPQVTIESFHDGWLLPRE